MPVVPEYQHVYYIIAPRFGGGNYVVKHCINLYLETIYNFLKFAMKSFYILLTIKLLFYSYYTNVILWFIFIGNIYKSINYY